MQHRALLSGLLVSAALLMGAGPASTQQAGGGLAASGLVGELQGPTLVLDPAQMAEDLQRSRPISPRW